MWHRATLQSRARQPKLLSQLKAELVWQFWSNTYNRVVRADEQLTGSIDCLL